MLNFGLRNLKTIIEVDLGFSITEKAGHNLMEYSLPPKDTNSTVQALRKVILDELEEHRDDTVFPLKPQKILSDVRAVMGEEEQDVPSVIDCRVNYEENVKLTDKLGKLTCPI